MIRAAFPTTNLGLPRRYSQPRDPADLPAHPLLAHATLDEVLAWRQGRTFSVAEFLAAVEAVASRLPTKRYAINLCQDRYHFLIGFAAALLARQTSLFPTCRATGALAQLCGRYPEAYVLTDNGDVPAGMPTLDVRPCVMAAPSCHRIPIIPSEQVAAVVFTSGSSGAPRAHAKTWGSLVMGAEALGRRFRLETGTPRVAVGTVPAQHMYGLETTIMLPIQRGWSIHAGHPTLPADMRAALRGLTMPVWLMTTPVHLRAYVGQETGLAGVEGVISATMPLTRALAEKAERLWRVPVYEIYGCTEGGVIGTRRTTMGEQWSLCRGLRLRQDGDAAWVSGGHVGQELRLADRITVHSDDQFLLHGPGYDLVKIAGKRASLAALNAALLRIDGVVDGAFYWPGEGRNAIGRLTAFVVAPRLSKTAILAALRTSIDPVFLPRPLHLVEALPRNAMGKLPREQLHDFAARFIAPRHSRRG